MLWRALRNVKNGRYIDIGAQDPIVDSVSLMFYEHGWRGIHVEPIPSYAELLRQARPDEIVIQAAVADNDGIMSFYEFPDTGLSTGDREIAEKHINSGFRVREIVVPRVTLDDVFSRESGQEVHWLKIDVEGGEGEVLKGWIHSPVRPWVVLIESTLPRSQIETHSQWESLILSKGYRFTHFDGLNRFYIADGHPELLGSFASGPNVFDDFTLNGTATGSISVTLNNRIRSLESQRESERQEAEKHLTSRRGEFLEQLGALRVEIELLKRDSAVEQRELHGRLQTTQADFAKLSFTLTHREREFSDRLQALQVEASAASRQLAVKEQEFSAQLLAFQAAAASEAQSFAEKQHDLNAQLLASQAEAARIAQTLAAREGALTAELRESKQHSQAISQRLDAQEQELTQQRAEAIEHVRAMADAQREDMERRLNAEHTLAVALRDLETLAASKTHAESEAAKRGAHWSMEMNQIRSESARVHLQLTQCVREREAEAEELHREAGRMRERHEQQISIYRDQIKELGDCLCALSIRLSDVAHKGLRSRLHSRFAYIAPNAIISVLHKVQGNLYNASELTMDSPLFTRTNYQPPFIVSSDGVYRLEDFLVLHDRNFVRAAYAAILRRDPDPDGEAYYLEQVRSGEHKAKLLGQILQSEEARKHQTVIHGLQRHLNLTRLCEFPVLGQILSAVFFLLSIDAHMRDLRVLESHVIRIAEEGQMVQESNLQKLRSLIK